MKNKLMKKAKGWLILSALTLILTMIIWPLTHNVYAGVVGVILFFLFYSASSKTAYKAKYTGKLKQETITALKRWKVGLLITDIIIIIMSIGLISGAMMLNNKAILIVGCIGCIPAMIIEGWITGVYYGINDIFCSKTDDYEDKSAYECIKELAIDQFRSFVIPVIILLPLAGLMACWIIK